MFTFNRMLEKIKYNGEFFSSFFLLFFTFIHTEMCPFIGNTPLHYGACGGFTDVVRELVMNGANVEIHNENGHTPLMEAASAGHVEVAKILLEHGAGINTHSNEFKESALTLACYKGVFVCMFY